MEIPLREGNARGICKVLPISVRNLIQSLPLRSNIKQEFVYVVYVAHRECKCRSDGEQVIVAKEQRPVEKPRSPEILNYMGHSDLTGLPAHVVNQYIQAQA